MTQFSNQISINFYSSFEAISCWILGQTFADFCFNFKLVFWSTVTWILTHAAMILWGFYLWPNFSIKFPSIFTRIWSNIKLRLARISYKKNLRVGISVKFYVIYRPQIEKKNAKNLIIGHWKPIRSDWVIDYKSLEKWSSVQCLPLFSRILHWPVTMKKSLDYEAMMNDADAIKRINRTNAINSIT